MRRWSKKGVASPWSCVKNSNSVLTNCTPLSCGSFITGSLPSGCTTTLFPCNRHPSCTEISLYTCDMENGFPLSQCVHATPNLSSWTKVQPITLDLGLRKRAIRMIIFMVLAHHSVGFFFAQLTGRTLIQMCGDIFLVFLSIFEGWIERCFHVFFSVPESIADMTLPAEVGGCFVIYFPFRL